MGKGTESILVIDDEAGMCRLLQAVLVDAGYRVTALQNPEEAVKLLEREPFDLVISDVRMPNLSGVDVLKAVKRRSPNTAVILVTAFGTTKAAVEAMRLGTSDYISKPFRNEEIRLVVEAVLERQRLASENRRLRQELAALDGFSGMIGVSPAMRQAFRQLSEAAESEETLLIEGEPGSGREAAARCVHLSGARAAKPFVVSDGSTLSPDHAEELLFGDPAGAFADPFAGQAGFLASAEGGTIFLKNPEELPESVQSKLLRCLQNRKIRRPGSVESSSLDMRVILAVGPEPGGARSGQQDRFRRLAALRATLPPLRERREDIAPLAAHFLARTASRGGKAALSFTSEAVEALRAHDWPGNARELQDVVAQSAAAAAQGRIEAADLPSSVAGGLPLPSRKNALSFRDAKQAVVESFERAYLVQLLKASEGNMTRAAAAAEMDRKNLYELLKKHDLDPR